MQLPRFPISLNRFYGTFLPKTLLYCWQKGDFVTLSNEILDKLPQKCTGD